MMDSIYLHGSEDVSRAASSMREAAQEMSRASMNITEALQMHQLFMDDWLLRFEEALLASKEQG